ncbi:hypothetical protein EYF80_049135 [Liparis tanakae]|uniref:Uncharacterized protein n=1 Tax=Liparis tanakae TaxID=230148 RepID=A0A4Z2FIU2_9TELE|nr:hypothetical protein EYF80_049135 [Liparis tanakae]
MSGRRRQLTDSDVDAVAAPFARVDVDPAGVGERQEGGEAQQVDGGDEGKHGRPGAGGLDEVAGEVHQEDACRGGWYLWLKVMKPMVADTKATAQGKVVLPHRRRVNTLDTPMEKN